MQAQDYSDHPRKDIERVFGPYMDSTGRRRIVLLHFKDGTRKTTAHARWLMECHLGRELDRWDETVDHIDGDPLNDSLDNLQLLTLADNIRKSAPDAEMFRFVCPECGEEAVKPARNVRGNKKKCRTGPYCGRRCAGRASARRQYASRSGGMHTHRAQDAAPFGYAGSSPASGTEQEAA